MPVFRCIRRDPPFACPLPCGRQWGGRFRVAGATSRDILWSPAGGVVWSVPTAQSAYDFDAVELAGFTHPTRVFFAVSAEHHTIARAMVRRYLLAAQVGHRLLRTRGLYGEYFRPSAESPRPAVLVLGGSEGGLNPLVIREAALLADHGYTALALAYFREPGLPATLSHIPLEYFTHALNWLQQQPGVDRRRLAVMGTSRGGELALLLAAHDRRLHAVISYSGSGVVVSAPGTDGRVPAWTWRGKPVPWAPSERDWRHGLIPVSQINGPMLLIAGTNDRLWPSPVLLRTALTDARLHHHPFPDRLLVYKGAGHLIQPPYTAVDATIGSRYGGNAADQERADEDSWRHVLRFLLARFPS